VRRVVVDASAFAAITFGEAEAAGLVARLDGADVFAPTLLKFELINTAWKKVRRQPAEAPAILKALTVALDDRWTITWRDVVPADVALVAFATGLTAYDASYLWLAGSLGADLVTLDTRLASAASTTPPSTSTAAAQGYNWTIP
jgi:predicted nucleic acid-binding protein